MAEVYPLWKFILGGKQNESSNCILYHRYIANRVNGRSVSYKGVNHIWRHFLKWDHCLQQLFYYDGRDNPQFNIPILNKDLFWDKENNKLYFNIQVKDKLIWTWLCDLSNLTLQLRQWEKKICKLCDKHVIYRDKDHKNYEYDSVLDKHKPYCKNSYQDKFGLQDKYYYLFYELKHAYVKPPLDTRKTFMLFKGDSWSIVRKTIDESTPLTKYIDQRRINNPYTTEITKDEHERDNQTIRSLINKSTIDNIQSSILQLKSFDSNDHKNFITKHLYKTYITKKNYPHLYIIEELALTKNIFELFIDNFKDFNRIEDDIKRLKYNTCLLSLMYKNKFISAELINTITQFINSSRQVDIIIYFFIWDSKFGLSIGPVHESIRVFEILIKKIQTYYEDVSPKTQFAIDDLLEM